MMMRKALTFAFAAGATATTTWNYRDIEAWPEFKAADESPNQCLGTFQSPIDIVSDARQPHETMGALQFTENAALTQTEIQVGTHTWEVDWDTSPAAAAPAEEEATERRLGGSVEGEGGTGGIEWKGEFYSLQQFHYHSPSENTVNGMHYDMETHLVHKDADGKYLVIAVFLKVGKENEYLEGFWNDLAGITAATRPVSTMKMSSPYSNFLPKDKSYYSYDGSFTTPPCTEGTTWIVLSTPVELSAEQLASYRAGINSVANNQLAPINTIIPDKQGAIPGVSTGYSETLNVNNRPVQSLNGRVVSWYHDPIPKEEAEKVEAEKEKDMTALWVTLSCIAGLAIVGLLTALTMHCLKKAPKKSRAIKEVPRPQDVVMMVPQPVQTQAYPMTTYAAPSPYAQASPYVIR